MGIGVFPWVGEGRAGYLVFESREDCWFRRKTLTLGWVQTVNKWSINRGTTCFAKRCAVGVLIRGMPFRMNGNDLVE